VLWYPKDVVVVPIEKDPNWAEINVPKIQSFFVNRYLPVVFPML